MLKLRKIAITGGIASGKTTVCQFFKELGAFVVNADAIVHQLLNPNTDLGQRIIQRFGFELLENGTISREKLGIKVFHDPKSLTELEELLHPAVFQRIEELYREACQTHQFTAFVVEIPLLFETRSEPFYDVVVAVLASDFIAQKRFEKSGFPPSEYALRMNRQMAPQKKAEEATYVLYNNGSLDELRAQVKSLNFQILNP
jgi:dephospho-CoA kinase